MNAVTLAWLTLGACLVYLVAQDSNVYDWLVLQSRFFAVKLQRVWFRVRYHPDSPWVQFAIRRNANKIARELIKEKENG